MRRTHDKLNENWSNLILLIKFLQNNYLYKKNTQIQCDLSVFEINYRKSYNKKNKLNIIAYYI
jgi:hypothetical protein